jgi:HTH-type transcriptional regulator / antitoxin HigA
MTNRLPPFSPNWVSPPGETISDLLEERDWTQVQLAERLGHTPKHVSLNNSTSSNKQETCEK